MSQCDHGITSLHPTCQICNLESRLARLEEEKAQALEGEHYYKITGNMWAETCAQAEADRDTWKANQRQALKERDEGYRLWKEAAAREAAMRERLGEAIAVIEKRTEHELDYGGTRGCRVGLTDLEKDCRCWRNPTLKRLRAAIAPDAGRAQGATVITMLVCPFCGIEPTIESWHGGPTSKRRIGCSNDACPVAPGVTGDTEQIAVKRWNTRALAAEVEKLREVAKAATALLEHPDVKPYAEHFIRIAGTEAQKSMRTFGALVGQLRNALAKR